MARSPDDPIVGVLSAPHKRRASCGLVRRTPGSPPPELPLPPEPSLGRGWPFVHVTLVTYNPARRNPSGPWRSRIWLWNNRLTRPASWQGEPHLMSARICSSPNGATEIQTTGVGKIHGEQRDFGSNGRQLRPDGAEEQSAGDR